MLTSRSALMRYIDRGMLRADNNWVENQIRPIALGRSNWSFAHAGPMQPMACRACAPS
jgi:hypothetical protein